MLLHPIKQERRNMVKLPPIWCKPINGSINQSMLTSPPGGPFDLDLGRVPELDNDLEDPQEELLAGGLTGEQGHGGQL